MRDGWIWADEEFPSSPMEFAWDDGDDDEEWDEDLGWEDEIDDLDEEWDDEDDDEWEEWEEEFEDDDDDSLGRKRQGRPIWN